MNGEEITGVGEVSEWHLAPRTGAGRRAVVDSSATGFSRDHRQKNLCFIDICHCIIILIDIVYRVVLYFT
jgi:hypothetical protein